MYLQPNAPDPVLEEERVLALVRRHAPADRMRGVDESGGEASAYFVDDDKVLKVQRPHRLRPRTSLEKEAFFLNELAAYPEIIVPKMLGYGRYGDIEYLCMTRMRGVAARNVDVQGEPRRQMLQALGRTLRRLHGISQGPFRDNALFPGDRSFEEFLARLQSGVEQTISAVRAGNGLWGLPISPEALSQEMIKRLPVTVTLVALHSNPGPEHTFVDPNSGRFIGLIDFGDAYISHPAFDIRWPSEDDRQSILNGYQEEEPLGDDSLRAWHAVLTLSDMTALTSARSGPERKLQAQQNLEETLRSI